MSEQTYNLTDEEIASAVAHVLTELADNIPPGMTTAEVWTGGNALEFTERGDLVEWLEGATAKEDAIRLFHEALDKMDPTGE